MYYISTRDPNNRITASQAIMKGLSADGGLFLPEEIPQLPKNALEELGNIPYCERAAYVLSLFLTDFSYDELLQYTTKAYSAAKFGTEKIAPMAKLNDRLYVLELYHGPTCAFKDFALQLLPYLLTAALRKNHCDKTVVILTATSGDTGKAALEGFCDVNGTKIGVFYPDGATSKIQRLQMTTQGGENVAVFAVKGNFDDAQNGVKQIFTDTDFAADLCEKGYVLSSANSINWGRLVPQIAYYVSCYCDLCQNGAIKQGEKIDVVVPTGNFGNILAAYYAKQMGVPIEHFICASNQNNVLTEFFTTGRYDRNRPFYTTISPSMDILVSSNLERLLFMQSHSTEQLKDWMQGLAKQGVYELPKDIMQEIRKEFIAGFADDAECKQTINHIWKKYGYLADPHTAVGLKVYQDCLKAGKTSNIAVVAATASPFKFAGDVLQAIEKDELPADEFERLTVLKNVTGLPIPDALYQLRHKAERFTKTCKPQEMPKTILSWLA